MFHCTLAVRVLTVIPLIMNRYTYFFCVLAVLSLQFQLSSSTFDPTKDFIYLPINFKLLHETFIKKCIPRNSHADDAFV